MLHPFIELLDYKIVDSFYYDKLYELKSKDRFCRYFKNFNCTGGYGVYRKINYYDKMIDIKNITVFNLEGNNTISEIQNLDCLLNLRELDLPRNKIKTIQNLDKLTNLTKLHIYSNNIKTIQ